MINKWYHILFSVTELIEEMSLFLVNEQLPYFLEYPLHGLEVNSWYPVLDVVGRGLEDDTFS